MGKTRGHLRMTVPHIIELNGEEIECCFYIEFYYEEDEPDVNYCGKGFVVDDVIDYGSSCEEDNTPELLEFLKSYIETREFSEMASEYANENWSDFID